MNALQFPSNIRSYARQVDAKRKTIECCPGDKRLSVCIVLVIEYNWAIENLPTEYQAEVKKSV